MRRQRLTFRSGSSHDAPCSQWEVWRARRCTSLSACQVVAICMLTRARKRVTRAPTVCGRYRPLSLYRTLLSNRDRQRLCLSGAYLA